MADEKDAQRAAQDILEHCEGLSYNARMSYMVDVGREARETSSTAAALAHLSNGSLYERLMALQSCYGSRDIAFVQTCLESKSQKLSYLATKLTPLVCPEDDMHDFVMKQSRYHQKRCLIYAKRHKRYDALSAFFHRIKIERTAIFHTLLPCAPPLFIQDTIDELAESFVRSYLKDSNRQSTIETFLKDCQITNPELLKSADTSISTVFDEDCIYALVTNLNVFEWESLTRSHPELVLHILYDIMSRDSALNIREQSLWQFWIEKLFPELIVDRKYYPTDIEIARLYLKRGSFSSLNWLRPMVSIYIHEVVQLHLEFDGRYCFQFKEHAAKLSLAELTSLAKHASALGVLWQWLGSVGLRHLSPEFKEQIYITVLQLEPKLAQDDRYIKCWPTKKQEEIARSRIAETASLSKQMSWSEFLPKEERLEMFRRNLNDTDLEVRAEAMKGLILVTASEQSAASYHEALKIAQSHSRDQDLVRRYTIAGLRNADTNLWQDEHIPGLSRYLQECINAINLSPGSVQSMCTFLVKLLPYHPKWAWETLLDISLRHNCRLTMMSDRPLTLESLKVIAPVLIPTAREWAKPKPCSDVVEVLRLFKKFISSFPELLEIAIKLIDGELHLSVVYLFRDELTLYPELLEAIASRARREPRLDIIHQIKLPSRIPKLLAIFEDRLEHEEDLVAIRALVEEFKASGHNVSNEILYPALKKKLSSTNNLDVAKTIMSFLINDPGRTPVEFLLQEILHDESLLELHCAETFLQTYHQEVLTKFLVPKYVEGRFNVEKSLIVIWPSEDKVRWLTEHQQNIVSDQAVMRLKSEKVARRIDFELSLMAKLHFANTEDLIQFIDDDRPFVRDKTISKLTKLDELKGFEPLARCLADDRASAAIYQIEKLLKRMPSNKVIGLLSTVPLKKVTIAKQIVRIASSFHTDEAYHFLVSIERSKPHRDVRTELLLAFRSFVKYGRTWEIFKEAASDASPGVAQLVIPIEVQNLDSAGLQGLRNVMEILLSHPSKSIRYQTLHRLECSPVFDPEFELISGIVSIFNSQNDRFKAWTVLLQQYPQATNTINGCLEQVSDIRSLKRLVEGFQWVAEKDRARSLPVARLLLEKLATMRLTICLRTRVILNCLPCDELITALIDIGPQLHADALANAKALIVSVRKREDEDVMLDMEAKLRQSKHENLRRLGLSILKTYQPKDGKEAVKWAEHLANRLELYETDQSVMVAEAAMYLRASIEELQDSVSKKIS